eukprot:816805_1
MAQTVTADEVKSSVSVTSNTQSSKTKTQANKLKPGQKYPTPTRGFGDRVFYETLLRQKPESWMAAEWCVSYGVLTEEEAGKLYKAILKRKGKDAGVRSPVKRKSSSSSSSVSKSNKKKVVRKSSKSKRAIKEEVDDVGMDIGGKDAGVRSPVKRKSSSSSSSVSKSNKKKVVRKSSKSNRAIKEEVDDVGMDIGGSEIMGGVTL